MAKGSSGKADVQSGEVFRFEIIEFPVEIHWQQYATFVLEVNHQTRFLKGYRHGLKATATTHAATVDGLVQTLFRDGAIRVQSGFDCFHSSISTPSRAPTRASRVLFSSGS